MTQNRYTIRMENQLFSQWDVLDNAENDYSVILNFLNDSEAFQSFGDSLLALIRKKAPEAEADTVIQYLGEACRTAGVDLKEIGSVNTLKSWFRGGPRPKKGEASRDAMFALAFALRFSPDETAELFHKAYLDRAFDFRNERELVYYYCLRNGRSWRDAKDLISRLDKPSVPLEGHTLYTTVIKDSAD